MIDSCKRVTSFNILLVIGGKTEQVSLNIAGNKEEIEFSLANQTIRLALNYREFPRANPEQSEIPQYFQFYMSRKNANSLD
jgi:hypothetical protein